MDNKQGSLPSCLLLGFLHIDVWIFCVSELLRLYSLVFECNCLFCISLPFVLLLIFDEPLHLFLLIFLSIPLLFQINSWHKHTCETGIYASCSFSSIYTFALKFLLVLSS
jgi:hypothetical protein